MLAVAAGGSLCAIGLPGLATTGLLAFIQAWDELLFALSFILTLERQTFALVIKNFQPQGPGFRD